MDYPDNCIKGIPNNTFITNEGTPTANLFYFPENPSRGDEWVEQSINWEDGDSAVEFTLNQKKDTGEIHFKGGAAILSRNELERLNNRPQIKGLLSYERKPLPNNRYHGNLLMKSGTSKQTMKLIASAIALSSVEKLVPPKNI